MLPIQEQASLFIDDVIQGKLRFQIDSIELEEWKKLKDDILKKTPYSSNSGNVSIQTLPPMNF